MSGSKRKGKSAVARLKQIGRIVAKLDKQIEALDDAPHVPRKKPLQRGQVLSPLTECDPSCSTCAKIQRRFARKMMLRDPQQDALVAVAQSRLASDAALSKSRQKITAKKYFEAIDQAGNRTALASLLDVTPQGLSNWEKRNGIKWTKDKGLFLLPR